MSVMTTAGSTFGLSASLPATYDATGFNALTYTTVGEITDLGEVGREYNTVTHSPIGNRRTQKIKGSYNAGSMALQMGRDYTDAGQTMLQAALNSDNAYSIRVVLQSGKKLYFTGLVSSYKTSMGGVDQITGLNVNIEVVSDIVEV